MRSRYSVAACAVLACVLIAADSAEARIDATKGRTYRLTKQHGPWMIMVASLSEPPEERKGKGIGPQKAAEMLVYELRRNGIPAYTYRMNGMMQSLETQDRQGRTQRRKYRAQKESFCVIAGNYPSRTHRTARNTLQYIKTKFDPRTLKENGGWFAITPGRPGPFSNAFLTVNPMLSPADLASQKKDPLLLRLNAGSENSILENKGQYTLTVATFSGRSTTSTVGGTKGLRSMLDKFKVSARTLDTAGERAWVVAKMLREGRFDGIQKGRTFEAYVFHDRYQSLVTIGSFSSPNDPRIAQLSEVFRAKTKTGPDGRPTIFGESIVIPGTNPPDTVVFDPKPKLIKVPELR